jgi:hypothetical protein
VALTPAPPSHYGAFKYASARRKSSESSVCFTAPSIRVPGVGRHRNIPVACRANTQTQTRRRTVYKSCPQSSRVSALKLSLISSEYARHRPQLSEPAKTLRNSPAEYRSHHSRRYPIHLCPPSLSGTRGIRGVTRRSFTRCGNLTALKPTGTHRSSARGDDQSGVGSAWPRSRA